MSGPCGCAGERGRLDGRLRLGGSEAVAQMLVRPVASVVALLFPLAAGGLSSSKLARSTTTGLFGSSGSGADGRDAGGGATSRR